MQEAGIPRESEEWVELQQKPLSSSGKSVGAVRCSRGQGWQAEGQLWVSFFLTSYLEETVVTFYSSSTHLSPNFLIFGIRIWSILSLKSPVTLMVSFRCSSKFARWSVLSHEMALAQPSAFDWRELLNWASSDGPGHTLWLLHFKRSQLFL